MSENVYRTYTDAELLKASRSLKAQHMDYISRGFTNLARKMEPELFKMDEEIKIRAEMSSDVDEWGKSVQQDPPAKTSLWKRIFSL